MSLHTLPIHHPLVSHSQTLGNTYGCEVPRTNERDQALKTKFVEAVIHGCCCGLGGIALSPVGPRESPAQFPVRYAIELFQAQSAPANELTGGAEHHCPL